MSTNSLQLNWNSQILTEEDGHFKLLGRDKEPTKYTCTTGTLSVFWLAFFVFFVKSGCGIQKIKKNNMKRHNIRVFKHTQDSKSTTKSTEGQKQSRCR